MNKVPRRCTNRVSCAGQQEQTKTSAGTSQEREICDEVQKKITKRYENFTYELLNSKVVNCPCKMKQRYMVQLLFIMVTINPFSACISTLQHLLHPHLTSSVVPSPPSPSPALWSPPLVVLLS